EAHQVGGCQPYREWLEHERPGDERTHHSQQREPAPRLARLDRLRAPRTCQVQAGQIRALRQVEVERRAQLEIEFVRGGHRWQLLPIRARAADDRALAAR